MTPESDHPITWKERLEQYKRREHMASWFAGGYVGLLTLAGFLSSSITSYHGKLLVAFLFTLIVVGGGLVGLARVGFEWSATVIERKVADGKLRLDDVLTPEENAEWPKWYEREWQATQWILRVAGICAIAVGWFWAYQGTQASATPTPGPRMTYFACVSSQSGELYNVTTSGRPACLDEDSKISWNQVGPTGARGPRGATGASGAIGARGATGPRGVNGARGAIGPRGARGPNGATGANGAIGARGATGPRGAHGATGAIGPRGARGPKGATGATGRRGARGPKGATGDADSE